MVDARRWIEVLLSFSQKFRLAGMPRPCLGSPSLAVLLLLLLLLYGSFYSTVERGGCGDPAVGTKSTHGCNT